MLLQNDNFNNTMSHILLQNDNDINEAVLKEMLPRTIKSKIALTPMKKAPRVIVNRRLMRILRRLFALGILDRKLYPARRAP